MKKIQSMVSIFTHGLPKICLQMTGLYDTRRYFNWVGFLIIFLISTVNTALAESVSKEPVQKISSDRAASSSKAVSDSDVKQKALKNKKCEDAMNYSGHKLRSNELVDFCENFSDKTLLVVNTASQCGYTPQFKELEALYKKYKDKGLEVVGFPSNDFNQEYSDSEKTASLCYENYGVTFTMMETSPVKGENANEFFQWLSDKSGEQPAWNFNKYLVGAAGSVKHYGSSQKPLAGDIEKDIQSALKLN